VFHLVQLSACVKIANGKIEYFYAKYSEMDETEQRPMMHERRETIGEMRTGGSLCIKVCDAYLALQGLVIEHKAALVIIHDRISGRPGTGPSYYSVRIRGNDDRRGSEFCM